MPDPGSPSSYSDPRSILITGAARGLGAALAQAYASQGVHLFLADTRAELLGRTADRCREAGARVQARETDIRDRQAMEDWVSGCDDIRPLDLIVANAAVSHGSWSREENEEEMREVFGVNLDGLLNTILPGLKRLRSRGRGQIALLSSPAGVRGLPVAPSYCATKAAVRVLGEGLAARLHKEGIIISVVQPGFIDTPMTGGNNFRMPLLMKADRAARIIKRKLARGKTRIVFPRPVALALWVLRFLPGPLLDRVLRLR